jgi:hypothetical protein
MKDGSTRIIGLACVMLGVWVITYWFYQPRRVVVDQRPSPILIGERPNPAPTQPTPATPPAPAEQGQPTPNGNPAPLPGPTKRVQKLLPPQFREYTVQKGDTSFDRIAARKEVFGSAKLGAAVSRSNPFVSPDRLKPGVTVLKIPIDPENIQGKLVWVDEGPDGQIVPVPPTPDFIPPAPNAGDKSYTLQGEDTLSSVAERFYGKSSMWKIIADANKDVIPNPNMLKPGTVIRIPPAP